MSDIQAKYQKLATEYSKLRAQLPVLKKAVLDEQAKTEELQECLKERDQSVRKYEQELDSLMFRNQQLSSRVAVLQQELDESEAKSRKNKKWTVLGATFTGTGSKPVQSHGGDVNTYCPEFTSHSSVIGEELQNKIEENERLHKQVYEAKLQYEETIGQLQEKLMLLEAETSHHQESLNAAVEHSCNQICRLQEDKTTLETKLQKQEIEAKELRERAYEAETKLERVQEELGTRLQKAEAIIEYKLAFNDSDNPQLNSLNIPPHNHSQQLHTRELVGQAARLIKELVQGLSNYYTYSEQRSKVYPIDADVDTLSDVNKRYCQYLHENTLYLRPVEQTFSNFNDSLKDEVLVTLETATGLAEFAGAFKKFVSYTSKLLPYQLLSLDEENSVSSCTSSLESSNKALCYALKSFVNTLSKLDTYVSIIATQSGVFTHHPRSSHIKMFEVLSSAITDFHEVTRELTQCYTAKISLESQLPTVTQKLRVTDECMMATLNNLVTCTSKISAFFAGNLEFIKKALGLMTAGLNALQSEHTHPYVNTYRQRAAQYMAMITRSCPESVPYKTAIHNRRTLISSTESRDTLTQQVVGYQEKICKLEQEKEHWMLESQLIQMKHMKESQKVIDLEKKLRLLEAKLSGSIEDNLENSTMAVRPEPLGSASKLVSNQPFITDKSLLGHVETVSTGETDLDNREQLIRQHFSNRISELTFELQISDSKALYFHAECRALHQQLKLCQRDNDLIQAELTEAKQGQAQLKDELQTTTRSYEGQLSMMSEHLAAINEKLTAQKDEIDVLKYQLNNYNKSNKKGRLT